MGRVMLIALFGVMCCVLCFDFVLFVGFVACLLLSVLFVILTGTKFILGDPPI